MYFWITYNIFVLTLDIFCSSYLINILTGLPVGTFHQTFLQYGNTSFSVINRIKCESKQLIVSLCNYFSARSCAKNYHNDHQSSVYDLNIYGPQCRMGASCRSRP